jgi:two-component system sensor histidine kinase TtrS
VLRAAGRDGEVAISVADQGRGVPADEMTRVFEPFYSTRPGRMGLGMTICQTIAAAHGGRLTGAANPDGGVTFTLVLPAALP